MGKCNFIYGHMKITAFTAPICGKLKNDGQHYAKISDTEFHPMDKKYVTYRWKFIYNYT
jgi:hypothetical protein